MTAWYERLEKIPKAVYYAAALIVLIAPLYFPLHLPIGITDRTRVVYNTVEGLSGTGKRVLYLSSTSPMFWGEMQHIVFAYIQHLFKIENVPLVIVPTSPQTIPLIQQTLDKVENPHNKVYGVDYVYLTLVPPPTEASFPAMAANFRAQFTTDIYGTPLEDLPIMNDIYSIDDFDVIFYVEAARGTYAAGRFIWPKYPDKIYFSATICEGYMFLAPLIGPGNQYLSGLVGAKGGAEYQILMGGPYTGAKAQMDSLSGYNLLGVVIIIIGNIAAWGRRRRKEAA